MRNVAYDPGLDARAADRAAALQLTPVSRETVQRLDAFVALLLTWQQRQNLVAPSTIPQVWTRHIADSLQLLPLAPGALRWLDLGSGAGFPGVVLACSLAENPGAKIHLVDSQQRRAAFLHEAVRTLDLPAIVHCQRIEDFSIEEHGPVEIITARALAPMARLAGWLYPLMHNEPRVLLLKGQDVGQELNQASRSWDIEAELVPSKTNPLGRVVVMRRLRPRSTGKEGSQG